MNHIDKIKTIGEIHSSFTDLKGMPIQPKAGLCEKGKAVIKQEYADGLKDLNGFSHIYLIYIFHKTTREKLLVKPFLDNVDRGVFSTRSPLRPSHLGISVVKLDRIEQNTVYFSGCDILNNTPLIDIKPYIFKFDGYPESTSGWMKNSEQEISQKKSDDRFI